MSKYSLSYESIDMLSEFFVSKLQSLKVSKQTVLKARLTAEDILLKYRERLGEDTKVFCRIEKRLSYNYFVIDIIGPETDPFSGLNEEEEVFNNAMQSMGCVPSWAYKNGKNQISFSFRRRWMLASWASILIIAALGALLGLGSHLLPDGVRTFVSDTVLSPLSDVIMGFLSTVSVLMIFLSIISGICEMGDVTTFNRIGKKLLSHFALGLLAAAGIMAAFAPIAFRISTGEGGGFDFNSLWQMILDIVPNNIVEAFYTGNTLQVIFLAVCVGVVALSLSRRVQALQEWTKQLNTLVQALIELIVRLLPVVVFVSIFTLTATGDLAGLKELYKYPLYFLIVCLLWSALLIIRTSITQRVNMITIMKKLFPTYIIALSTASSSAAFHTHIDTCENKLGVDKQLVRVGAPLAQPLYMPSVIIESCIATLCMSSIYNVEITWPKLITLLIMGYILAIATPPMPGAAISSFALIFAQMGVPSAAISLAIAVSVLTDRIATPTDVLSQQLELVQISGSLKKLNRDTLCKK